MQGCTPSSLEVQCTNAQIDIYLAQRALLGFTALNMLAIEKASSSQTPAYNNVDGVAPFTNMTGPNWVINDTYWRRVDYIVSEAKKRGMVIILWPAWFGFVGTGTGWSEEMLATADATLQAYGVALAQRFQQGNIIWAMGGDASLTQTYRDKQWNIAIGIRSINPNALFTAEPQRTEDTWSFWSGYTGFNVNTIYTRYTDNNEYGLAATAYGKSPAAPFFNVEGLFENDGVWTAADGLRQQYVTVLSGGMGYMFGNDPLWGFGSPDTLGGGVGPTTCLTTYLNTQGAQDMKTFGDFFRSYAWWKLVPKTDTSLVTTSLGTGNTRICPALASDGSFGMVWTRTQNFTVNLAAFAQSVTARWFDPSNGSYSTVGTFSNSGTQAFTAPGDRVLVLA